MITSNNSIRISLAILAISGFIVVGAQAEDALKDGNRIPTLLFEQNGAPKRVSNLSPLPITVADQSGLTAVTIASQSLPVPIKISTQAAPVAVTASQPFPVTVTNPFPSTATLSVGIEKVGPGTITLITPAPGKRVSVKGAAIMMETATGGEADVRFAGGQLIFKIYRGDQSGAVIPVFRDGAINENIQAVVTNISGGQKVFFVVNYEER